MIDQGTLQWRIDRMGIITASGAAAVMGTQRAREVYSDKLKTELKAIQEGREVEYLMDTHISARSLEHGIMMEPLAVAAYEMERDVDVEKVGLLLHEEHLFIGASLDGLVDNDGTIEVKSPFNEHIHIHTTLLGMPNRHIPQVQLGLEVSCCKYCDFVSFCPEYDYEPIYIERIERDDKYIKKMINECVDFYKNMVIGGINSE